MKTKFEEFQEELEKALKKMEETFQEFITLKTGERNASVER